jgi:hypothetical protein
MSQVVFHQSFGEVNMAGQIPSSARTPGEQVHELLTGG